MRTAPEPSFAECIASCPAGRETKEQTSAYVEGFNAARLDKVGLRWLEASERALDAIEGDRLFRLQGVTTRCRWRCGAEFSQAM